MMSLDAQLAILISVAMHVTWNLIARHQPAAALPLWWVLLAHLVLLAPWGFWSLLTRVNWTTELALMLCISAIANTVYFLGLRQAYHHASAALVYPLVRSSPLLIALWSLLLLDERLPAGAWLGIGVSVAGLLLMASSTGGSRDRSALPWAFLAMFATSVYSMSDKVAVAQLPDMGAVVGFVSVGYLASWCAFTLLLKREQGRWWPAQRIGLLPMLTGGLCIGLAYALVVYAMRTLPSAVVVACSNAGIVIAALISIVCFHERTAWQRRLFGAVVILTGILGLQLA
ncbi:EamA family transporter [Marinobacterium sediminicola]|uniref:Phosphonate utilization associated putative membrane protein n=1 Tax=Marinobacterium sediminicola TaxID=518898 RepID=A0ABY1RZ20_9GAMM|nr:EamA family transporter [Marinobacterium sediminicola]ULG68103.1 EamA family transporter [Marinobacterium sediminicola]SMR73385.1 phosphonate utilization associated putative membrane protein [Marinobacterium sediminicola]